ncbi:hypothetical protein LCGC14_1528830 [marine sediment metagenome]|uniref:Uncharacterized protein n=1 Tax=marine sediment metagenome TaxID=412755 RepID=A0A0F9IWE1_9ZZZZ
MATGDVIVFDEALEYLLDGGFEAADDVKCAILDNTATPTAAFATPALGDFTEVGAAGSYVAGGTSLGSLSTLVSEAAGTMTFDSATNPTWAQNASNDVDAWWGLIYNDTDVGNRAIAFVELGGPVDMTAGDLTITWNGSGIFTIA